MFSQYITGRGSTNAGMLPCADNGFLYICSRGSVGSYIVKSTDGGRSFSFPHKVSDTTCCSLVRLKNGGIMGLIWDKQPECVRTAKLTGTTYSVIFSYDEGQTWGGLKRVNEKEGCYYVMNDRLLRLASGRIVLAMMMHPEENFNNGIETVGLCGCYYSDDEGQSWRHSNWIGATDPTGHLAEPIIVELTDGRLKMFMRNTTGYMHVSISCDGGQTWQQESAITSVHMPLAPFCVNKDPYSGYIFMIWDNSFPVKDYLYPRSPLCMAVSRDDSETWDFMFELENSPDCNYGYPSLCFLPEVIIATYYINDRSRSYSSQNNRVMLKSFERRELTYRTEKREMLF